ncbi:MAG: hypothetical protein WC008_06130 [Bacilli bacterium]
MEQDIFYKGYKIKIRQDEDCESPNDWEDENLFLVYDHRQFTVKRKGFEPQDIYENSLTYEKNYWVLPVEAYIHSGVSLSLFSGTKQCRWDSSVSGYILASKEEFKDLETAKTATEGLIKTWNQYLSGEIYGFIIEKPNTIYSISKEEFDTLCITGTFSSEAFLQVAEEDTDWEEVDSCWGYYGESEESELLDEARMVIDNLVGDV